MRARTPIRVVSLALALLLILGLSACESKQQESIKGKATDFALKDIDGNTVSLSDFRGKVVMLEFWATTCPSCVKSMPEYVILHEKYKDRGFEVIGISMDFSVADVKHFVREKGIPFTILMSDKKVEKQYGIITIPVTFMLDKSGKVQKKHLGYGPAMLPGIEKEIKLLLEDMPLRMNKKEE